MFNIGTFEEVSMSEMKDMFALSDKKLLKLINYGRLDNYKNTGFILRLDNPIDGQHADGMLSLAKDISHNPDIESLVYDQTVDLFKLELGGGHFAYFMADNWFNEANQDDDDLPF